MAAEKEQQEGKMQEPESVVNARKSSLLLPDARASEEEHAPRCERNDEHVCGTRIGDDDDIEHYLSERDRDDQAGQDARSFTQKDEQYDDDEVSDDADDSDDEDSSALRKAARAGIRLLEENAQLAEEVRQLQLQLAHGNEENQELHRMLEERDAQMEHVTQHLRESIRENQSILSELNQAKEQVAAYKDALIQQQEQLQRSPRKRSVRFVSPKRTAQEQKLLSNLVLDGIAFPSSLTANGEIALANDGSPTMDGGDSQTNYAVGSAPVGSISPKRKQAAKLQEVEAKFEEEHRRNSVLKMELNSAQKKISELKPLNAQLHEAKEEIQLLRVQIDELEKKLGLSSEESAEERELIQSLRTTIEIYQTLDDPNQRGKHHHGAESDEDAQVRKLARMRRRKSEGCILAHTAPPVCWTNPVVDECFHSRDDSEAVLEILDNLAEQLLTLKQQEPFPRLCRSPGKPLQSEVAKAKDDSDFSVNVDTWSRTRFLEQQVCVLQDLLKRYRSQWRQFLEKRCSMENENADLLSRVEKLTLLLQRQCEACAHASESMSKEDEAWKSAASVYATLLRQASHSQNKEEESEAEQVCFSILRRLVDSWTADKSKRMHLHDWLANAIRRTGNRKPLYLPDLTGEIASGFQVLLVPILRERFGVQVQVEKRLRNIVVTDLKLHITETDSETARTCLQRTSRSLMWLTGVESAELEDNEWLGEFSRRKAARMCLGK